MIHEIDCDMLKWLDSQPDTSGVMHQANCFCTMGSGIAATIRKKYPEAYVVDCKTKRGDRTKLGCFSYVCIEKENKYVINLYSQFDFGYGKKHTSYDAIYDGMVKINQFAIDKGFKKIGCPKNMGCVLGGGNWTIVRTIIDVVFKDSPIDLYICNYEPKNN